VTYIHGSPKCKSRNSQVINFIILVIHNFIIWTTIERFSKAKFMSLKRTCQQHISHSNWNDVITLDSRANVLMVRNQTTNLICDHYYNSCFNFSNEECDPTLNIYISKTFQWFKKWSICTRCGAPNIISKSWNIVEIFQSLKWGSTWECWDSFFHTCENILEPFNIISFHSLCHALALVVNPRLKSHNNSTKWRKVASIVKAQILNASWPSMHN